MKRLKFFGVLFSMILIVGGANAYALTIDIDSLNNTYDNPITQNFEAGIYEVTVIGIVDGGEYNAWNAWGGNTSGNRGWLNAYRISSDQFDDIAMGDGIRYEDPLGALDNAVNVTFSLASAGSVNFFINDSYYSDNIGGISLDVSPVPEPATILLLGVGLLGLGVHGRKKLKK